MEMGQVLETKPAIVVVGLDASLKLAATGNVLK